MPKFQYSAIRANGEQVSGEIEGRDRSVVLGRLGEQGLHPIEVRDAEAKIAASRMFSLGGGAAGYREISVFTRELAWLLRAGMTLNAALEILARETFSPSFSALIST